jgi:hypothetical protein
MTDNIVHMPAPCRTKLDANTAQASLLAGALSSGRSIKRLITELATMC